ncbi:MAG: S41 family peptidase, partial [Bacteroidetes bacterium]|nr:S41 family peptidase [Bacteroidota bacterium]
MKKRFSIPLIVTVFVIAFIGGTQVNHLISGDNIYEQLSKFKDVLSLTEKYYVEDVDTKNLTEHAITGFLNELDPHSVYIKPQQMQKVTEDFQGRFEGIGVEFSIVNDTITVVQPIGGGPSATLGIMSNDKIVRIDGKSSVGFSTEQVMKGLKGPKGTKVSVSIHRAGNKDLLEFEIVRDVIPLYSVDVSTMLNDKVGYINVTRFAETTHKEMVAALTKLKGQGMKQLVLDLRSNPGGYLDQAVKMSDLFLEAEPGGKPRKIVYTLSRRNEYNEEYFAYTNSNEYEKMPLIVLISNGSASASEIVSGAVQDWDRGLIVGETSFGKGLVQRQFPLADGSALRLTISRYYTPSGRLIQRSYENKDKYQEEAFTREEEEGENIEHKESTADTSRPKFKTAKGRVILGGGGITPDFIVKPGNITKYSVQLNRRNMFYEFIAGYLTRSGDKIKAAYGSDMIAFNKRFVID